MIRNFFALGKDREASVFRKKAVKSLFFKNLKPVRRVKKAFLLMEVLVSLGLFALVSGSMSVPYYRFKQTLQKQYLELEAHRLHQLLQVIEQNPETIARFWPSWEAVDSRQRVSLSAFAGPFEEEAMRLWQIETRAYVVEQTPKRPRTGYPVWRRYLKVERQMLQGSFSSTGPVISKEYAFTLMLKVRETPSAEAGTP